MAKKRGIHDKLEKVRRPRVHIKFDVETLGAYPNEELPFVVGVMADLSGDAKSKLPKLADRNFIQIDRDNFDEVLRRQKPELNFKVKNTLADDGTEIGVQLKFESLKDFEPAQVAGQVPALKKLLDTRNKLQELITKVEVSDDLDNLLSKVLKSTDDQKQIATDLGIGASSEGDKGDQP
jgi:type VI secretion system protein ImpB